MAPKIGVMLSGCGVFDGSEIHEAVFTMLYLDEAGAEIVFIAPDVEQLHVVNHLAGAPAEGERRNVLVEAARIARGKIRDAATVRAAELDALILPGGFGAAKNLCTFATQGADCTAHPEVARLVREMHEVRKPLGFMCIAPAVAARVLGGGVELTIGNDRDTAAALEKMGARHADRPVDQIAFDATHNVVSAPAYMYDARPSEVARGIRALVAKVLERVGAAV
jgi:enhancing lycopene biosynthesis protein 2